MTAAELLIHRLLLLMYVCCHIHAQEKHCTAGQRVCPLPWPVCCCYRPLPRHHPSGERQGGERHGQRFLLASMCRVDRDSFFHRIFTVRQFEFVKELFQPSCPVA